MSVSELWAERYRSQWAARAVADARETYSDTAAICARRKDELAEAVIEHDREKSA